MRDLNYGHFSRAQLDGVGLSRIRLAFIDAVISLALGSIHATCRCPLRPSPLNHSGYAELGLLINRPGLWLPSPPSRTITRNYEVAVDSPVMSEPYNPICKPSTYSSLFRYYPSSPRGKLSSFSFLSPSSSFKKVQQNLVLLVWLSRCPRL